MTTTFNPSDKSTGITLSGANLVATSGNTDAWASVRGTTSYSSGKKCFEVTCTTYDGGNGWQPGLMAGTQNLDSYDGDTGGIGYQVLTTGDSNIYRNGSFAGKTLFTGGPAGVTYGIAVDLDNMRIWITNDGGANWWGVTTTGDPTVSSTGLDISVLTPPLFIGWSGLTVGGSADVATLKTTAPFSFTIPSGFQAWDTVSVPSGLNFVPFTIGGPGF